MNLRKDHQCLVCEIVSLCWFTHCVNNVVVVYLLLSFLWISYACPQAQFCVQGLVVLVVYNNNNKCSMVIKVLYGWDP